MDPKQRAYQFEIFKGIFRISGTVLFLSVILIAGKTLFIPLSFAVFISFILYPVFSWQVNKKVPESVAILSSLLIFFIVISILIFILTAQINILLKNIGIFRFKIHALAEDLFKILSDASGISSEQIRNYFDSSVTSSALYILPFIKSSVSYSFITIVLTILIPVYVFFILYYRKSFVRFLIFLFPEGKKELILNILHQTIYTYYRYIGGMVIVYTTVGTLNSLGLMIIGIPDPFLYGFTASILTIIPYIGIIAGAIAPIAAALLLKDSLWYPTGVIIIFTIVQILEANIIFPLAVGQRLKLNPLIVLLVAIAGGIVWGVSGLVLFIPITGIVKLISDRIPSMKSVSMLLEGK